VIATIMPITTKTTIAIWVQIQVGDIAPDSLPGRLLVIGEYHFSHLYR